MIKLSHSPEFLYSSIFPFMVILANVCVLVAFSYISIESHLYLLLIPPLILTYCNFFVADIPKFFKTKEAFVDDFDVVDRKLLIKSSGGKEIVILLAEIESVKFRRIGALTEVRLVDQRIYYFVSTFKRAHTLYCLHL